MFKIAEAIYTSYTQFLPKRATWWPADFLSAARHCHINCFKYSLTNKFAYGCVSNLVMRCGASGGANDSSKTCSLMYLNGGADNYSFQVSSILLPNRLHHTSLFLKFEILFPIIVFLTQGGFSQNREWFRILHDTLAMLIMLMFKVKKGNVRVIFKGFRLIFHTT